VAISSIHPHRARALDKMPASGEGFEATGPPFRGIQAQAASNEPKPDVHDAAAAAAKANGASATSK